jgi:hypothetical protein
VGVSWLLVAGALLLLLLLLLLPLLLLPLPLLPPLQVAVAIDTVAQKFRSA